MISKTRSGKIVPESEIHTAVQYSIWNGLTVQEFLIECAEAWKYEMQKAIENQNTSWSNAIQGSQK